MILKFNPNIEFKTQIVKFVKSYSNCLRDCSVFETGCYDMTAKAAVVLLSVMVSFAFTMLSYIYSSPVLYWKILNSTSILYIGRKPNKFRLPVEEKYVTMSPCCYNGRRTGNYLFNYAAMLYVAKKTGRIIFVPANNPETERWIDGIFDVNISRKNNYTLGYCPCLTINERFGAMTFDSLLDIIGTNNSYSAARTIFLCGYFQSWKVTRGIEIELRQLLHWRSTWETEVAKFWQENVIPKNETSAIFRTVGIHVRRGDFVQLERHGFSIVNSSYLHRSIRYFIDLRDNKTNTTNELLIFVVCSDDIDWVKSAIGTYFGNHSDTIRFVYSVGRHSAFDLRLLSNCKSIIITGGSYGWWAAWMVNGTTVYNKNYPGPGSAVASGFTAKDYYFPHWTPMS